MKLRKFWRFRPRVPTLALLVAIAALLVLANLSDEIGRRGEEVLTAQGELRFSARDVAPVLPGASRPRLWSVSYGWPFIWRQYIIAYSLGASSGVLGECHSAGRLAANAASWLIILIAPTIGCEWLLRRYRPRFRWSLRGMLVGMGLAAALCGWFVSARHKADLQDAVIAARDSLVTLERYGPTWLNLVGVDRYRRRVTGVSLDLSLVRSIPGIGQEADEQEFEQKEELLARVARLPELRYLILDIDELSPPIVDALRTMRHLRQLDVSMGYHRGRWSRDDQRIYHECLKAIGAMSDLERLNLRGAPIASESVACLAGLTKLKSLRLQVGQNDMSLSENSAVARPSRPSVTKNGLEGRATDALSRLRAGSRIGSKQATDAPLLSRFPTLPSLEALDLGHSFVGNRGLRYLTVLPKLKTLSLEWLYIGDREAVDLPLQFDPGLAELAQLKFLDEMTVRGAMASAAGIESLSALKSLKKLHIQRPYTGWTSVATLALDHGQKVQVLERELSRYRRAVEALRLANPGIIIDCVPGLLDSPDHQLLAEEFETFPDETVCSAVQHYLSDWKKGKRVNQALWPQPRGGN